MTYRIFLIIVAILLLSACGSKSDNYDALERPVKVGKIYKPSSKLEDMLSGTVVSRHESNPSFVVPGLLKKINVKVGSKVLKGTVLAEIDALNYAETYEAAKSKYEQTKSEVSRVEKLFKENSVAKNEYEKAISGLQSVTSMYEVAKNQLNSTKLYSPISGIVQAINIEEYQFVMPGVGVVTIVDTTSLSIETNISSDLYSKRDSFESFTGFSSLANEPIPLRISYLSPKANNSQLYKMVLEIEKKRVKNLAPGMTIEILLKRKSTNHRNLSVPINSVIKKDNKEFVWCVDTAKKIVNKKEIVSGNLDQEGRIIILQGLSGDETIVYAGSNKLEENQKIKILKE